MKFEILLCVSFTSVFMVESKVNQTDVKLKTNQTEFKIKVNNTDTRVKFNRTELACYSCLHDGRYLCLNESAHLHMQVCPGIPKQFKNISGIKEVCYKTFYKQRHKPRFLITRGCAVKADKFDPCNDLRKVAVIGSKAKCSLCEKSMCNESRRLFTIHVPVIIGVLLTIALSS